MRSVKTQPFKWSGAVAGGVWGKWKCVPSRLLTLTQFDCRRKQDMLMEVIAYACGYKGSAWDFHANIQFIQTLGGSLGNANAHTKKVHNVWRWLGKSAANLQRFFFFFSLHSDPPRQFYPVSPQKLTFIQPLGQSLGRLNSKSARLQSLLKFYSISHILGQNMYLHLQQFQKSLEPHFMLVLARFSSLAFPPSHHYLQKCGFTFRSF